MFVAIYVVYMKAIVQMCIFSCCANPLHLDSETPTGMAQQQVTRWKKRKIIGYLCMI